MQLKLNVFKKSNIAYIFQLQFENNTAVDCNLPVTAICNSIDRVGMIICHNKSILEPVDSNIYKLIDKTKDDVIVPHGQKYIIEREASLELIQGKKWSLAFQNARYLVNPNTNYEIYVHWDVFRSNSINWNFSIPAI